MDSNDVCAPTLTLTYIEPSSHIFRGLELVHAEYRWTQIGVKRRYIPLCQKAFGACASSVPVRSDNLTANDVTRFGAATDHVTYGRNTYRKIILQ